VIAGVQRHRSRSAAHAELETVSKPLCSRRRRSHCGARTGCTSWSSTIYPGEASLVKLPGHCSNRRQRLSKKSRCRSRVIGIFPNDAAIVSPLGTLTAEPIDEWRLTRGYMPVDDLGRGDPSETSSDAAARRRGGTRTSSAQTRHRPRRSRGGVSIGAFSAFRNPGCCILSPVCLSPPPLFLPARGRSLGGRVRLPATGSQSRL